MRIRMRSLEIGLATAAAFGALAAHAAAPAKSAPPVDYNRDVRPILSKSCFVCHGSDDGHRAAGLRLDVAEDATKPRGSRPPAIVPGSPAKSLLLARVGLADHAGRMPPPANGARLTARQVATLRAWIAQGAKYQQHWAFVAPRRPAAPAVQPAAWCRNPIDNFVLARLRKEGLKPSPVADRYALIRRVSFDLRGLPPTPQEVEAFVSDRSPGAYEKVVDRFLADPTCGERWARMWLDLARYADSAGYGSDPLRLNIWPYRDWVIQAFNRNLPYDQFITEQLAGDLLPDATPEQKMATAFHRNTMTNTEGGTDDEEWRVAAVKDRIDTTGQVFMGLTVGCAKCHSHKYDPITQKEYYSLFALLNQTADHDLPDETPVMEAKSPWIEEQQKKVDGQIAELKRQLQASATGAAPLSEEAAKKLQEQIAQLEKSRPAPKLPVLVELPSAQQRETRLMVKGNFKELGEKVEPGTPQTFHPLPAGVPRNRLGLAKWIVDPNNPLTARVAVNRLWAQLFGTGIVETEEDFGTQGAPPSHPELLDWLAGGFAGRWALGPPAPRVPGRWGSGTSARAWDMKSLLRLIVTSATYMQSSKVPPGLAARDPRNRLLARGPRFRLEAEMVRDQALALSGLLSRKMYGPSVYPPQPEGLWQAAFNGERTYPTSTGEDRYRRGLYTFWRRTVPYPSMSTFDAPSREVCVVRRVRTNTPLQAFVTLNDPVYVEAAQALARRIAKEGGATPEERLRFGLRLCLCRPPKPAEVNALLALYQAELVRYRSQPEEAKTLATQPLGPLPDGADAVELAALTVVANVLLNADGVLAKG
jgi:mono/diheme cytochrome c family protein